MDHNRLRITKHKKRKKRDEMVTRCCAIADARMEAIRRFNETGNEDDRNEIARLLKEEERLAEQIEQIEIWRCCYKNWG